MIMLATASADLPRTSIFSSGSTGGLAARTPLAIAILMPAASFSSSSASRFRMSAVSVFASAWNLGSDVKDSMMAVVVVLSSSLSTAYVSSLLMRL